MKQKLISLSPDVCLKVIVRSERYLGTLPLRSQETTGLIKSNVDSSKKVLSQLFLYFSLYIETEIYKLIYVSQFVGFIKRGKICVKFWYILWTTLSFNSNFSTFFSYFWILLIKWRVVRNCAQDFGLRFYFLANITFLFPLKSVLKVENPSLKYKNIKTIYFFEESRAWFSQ